MKKQLLSAAVSILAMILAPASRAGVVCSYSLPGSEPANLLYDASNVRLFASLFSSNAVYVLGHGCVLDTVLNTATGNPNGLAFDGTNLWVSLYNSDAVEKINVSTHSGTLYSVGSHPAGVAFDGTNVWVANSGSNTVTKLLASNGFVEGTITVGSYPYGVAVDSINGQTNIWVANRNSNTISVINTSTNIIVNTIPTAGEPQFFQETAYVQGPIYGGDMWISCYTGDVVEQFSSDGSLIASYQINGNPVGISAGPLLYGATHNGELFRSNGGGGVSYESVGSNNYGVAFNPNWNTIWMTDLNQGIIYELN